MDFVNYDAVPAAMLGVVKGEAQAYAPDESSALSLIESGELKAIVVFNDERSPLLKDVPTLGEAKVPRADDLAQSIGNHRLLMTSPGVPENIAKVLREATEMALNDPELLAKSAEIDLPVGYADANYVKELIDVRMDVARKYKDLVFD